MSAASERAVVAIAASRPGPASAAVRPQAQGERRHTTRPVGQKAGEAQP